MIDATRPTSARIENYLIGGYDNYPADRQAADMLLRVDPTAAERAIAAHEFVRGTLHQLARDGAHQLLDLRCGLPSWRPHWHRILMRRQPLARIVYCAADPMVLAHGQMMMEEAPGVRMIDVDPGGPGLLDHPVVQSHFNVTGEPVVVLASGLLEHLTDEAAARLLSDLSALAPGSVLVVTTSVCADAERADRIGRVIHRAAPGIWGRLRTPKEVKCLHPKLSSGLICTDTDDPQLATALIVTGQP
ncbi:SAM-dependent methyltransferase [Streptomyces sp. NPDC002276]